MELSYQRRKMILILMIMTPGIPEYLNGSSHLSTLFTSPPFFFFQLFANIAMYTAGALLIREFVIRRGKGWGSVLLLGLAFGIMEEGVAVHTFFLGQTNPVGLLGVYGRYAGFDWLWALGIMTFHSVYSITLPLLLLKLAFPDDEKKSLLGSLGIAVVLIVYIADIVVLNFFVSYVLKFTPPAFYYAFLLLLASLIVVAAAILPREFISARNLGPTPRNRRFYFAGMLLLPVFMVYYIIIPSIQGIHPLFDVLFFIVLYLLLLRFLTHNLPVKNNLQSLKWLSFGILTPLFVLSIVNELTLAFPLIFIPILIALFMLRRLSKIMNRQIEQQMPEHAHQP